MTSAVVSPHLSVPERKKFPKRTTLFTRFIPGDEINLSHKLLIYRSAVRVERKVDGGSRLSLETPPTPPHSGPPSWVTSPR